MLHTFSLSLSLFSFLFIEPTEEKESTTVSVRQILSNHTILADDVITVVVVVLSITVHVNFVLVIFCFLVFLFVTAACSFSLNGFCFFSMNFSSITLYIYIYIHTYTHTHPHVHDNNCGGPLCHTSSSHLPRGSECLSRYQNTRLEIHVSLYFNVLSFYSPPVLDGGNNGIRIDVREK